MRKYALKITLKVWLYNHWISLQKESSMWFMNSINISAELSNREWIIQGRCREAFMSWISMNYAEDQQGLWEFDTSRNCQPGLIETEVEKNEKKKWLWGKIHESRGPEEKAVGTEAEQSKGSSPLWDSRASVWRTQVVEYKPTENYSQALESMEFVLLSFRLAWDPRPILCFQFLLSGMIISTLCLSYHTIAC